MPDPFIVGPAGLPVYRYADWREIIEGLWRTAYGADADTRPESPDGLLIDTLALLMDLNGASTQSVWANSFFRTADQVGLGLILDQFGRGYLPALDTTTSGVWYGVAATVVHDGVGTGPVASVLSAGDSNGDRYEVDDGQVGRVPGLTDDGAVVVLRVVKVTDGNDYSIDVDAVEQATITTAGPADTVETLAATWALAIAADEPTWTVALGGVEPGGAALIVIDGKAEELIADGTTMTDPTDLDVVPAARLDMSAEVTGPKICLAGTLVTIETPITDIAGVTTTVDGALGRDLETPAELRARHYDQIFSGGKGTPASIRAAMLAQLPDPLVEFARVDENTSAVPVNGLPPHSFEPTFVGTATHAQVAAVVFDQKPAGIQSFGDVTTDVLDELGERHPIGTSRGVELYLHLSITVTAGEGFPQDGDPEGAIEEAVVAYLTQIHTLGLDFQQPTVWFAAQLAVQGIADLLVTADATPLPGDVPTLVDANIPIAPNEILRIDSSRVAVVIV